MTLRVALARALRGAVSSESPAPGGKNDRIRTHPGGAHRERQVMAALDIGHKSRTHGFIHDWLPLLILAAACFIVVALDLHA